MWSCAVLGAAACATPTAPLPQRGREAIQTDTTRYEARYHSGSDEYVIYSFAVVARFTNTSDRDIYLDRCFPDSPIPIYGLIAVVPENEWGSAYSPTWGCVGHDRQFRVLPRETRIDTLLISGPNGWEVQCDSLLSDGTCAYPREVQRHMKRVPVGTLEGAFRLRYNGAYCPDDHCQERVPPEYLQSNPFVVELER
jgi:hypothetical protein